MQTRPDHATLLDAVAQFLLAEVAPKVEGDKALQFRVLIAANLTSMMSSEVRTQRERLGEELKGLRSLLMRTTGPDDLETLDALNAELASRLRAGRFDDAALDSVIDHLFTAAKHTLEVTNPRFDVSDEPA